MENETEGRHKLGSSRGRDFVLQWGNRKRLRCVKMKRSSVAIATDGNPEDYFNRDRTTLSHPPLPHHHCSSSSAAALRDSPMKNLTTAKSTSSSPEKEDSYYTIRGSIGGLDECGKFLGMDTGGVLGGGSFGGGDKDDKCGGSHVWPKLLISLSSKEKEEDFMAMKGCKLPQRPKKRAKLIQRSLLLVSPGAWLSDLCQERYEVREKKASKKRPRGLKAMGGLESDSE